MRYDNPTVVTEIWSLVSSTRVIPALCKYPSQLQSMRRRPLRCVTCFASFRQGEGRAEIRMGQFQAPWIHAYARCVILGSRLRLRM